METNTNDKNVVPDKALPRGKNRAKMLPFHHNYTHIIKYKPFHCKVPGCTRRFKRAETLALHQDTHNDKKGWERRDEIQQGITDRSHTFDYIQDAHRDGTNSDPFQDAKYGRKEIMLYSLKNGYYKTNVQHEKTGETPLIIAAQWGEDAIVDLLLVRRCKVDLADGHGNTALAKAAMYNQVRICQKLLEAGADVNRPNDMMVRPVHRAAMYGHTELLKMLIDKYNADYRSRDNANRQCLDYAKLYGHETTLKYMKEVHKRPIEGKKFGIASQVDVSAVKN